MKFNIKDYPGKYAMHCKTKEEAEDFCKFLDSLGRRWCGNDRYTDYTNWDWYEKIPHTPSTLAPMQTQVITEVNTTQFLNGRILWTRHSQRQT